MCAQVFSRHAAEMSLCLMRADGSGYLEVSLDPITNKSGDVWHVQLSGLKVGACRAVNCLILLNEADTAAMLKQGHVRQLSMPEVDSAD
jgi:hypothetical protein